MEKSDFACPWCRVPLISCATGVSCPWCRVLLMSSAPDVACHWWRLPLMSRATDVACHWCWVYMKDKQTDERFLAGKWHAESKMQATLRSLHVSSWLVYWLCEDKVMRNRPEKYPFSSVSKYLSEAIFVAHVTTSHRTKDAFKPLFHLWK